MKKESLLNVFHCLIYVLFGQILQSNMLSRDRLAVERRGDWWKHENIGCGEQNEWTGEQRRGGEAAGSHPEKLRALVSK